MAIQDFRVYDWNTPATPMRPAKPSPDFPLFPHASRKWAKKIKGKLHYFGRWDDPDEALAEFRRFQAGPPKASHSGITVQAAATAFLVAKERKHAAGELAATSLGDYRRSIRLFVDHCGPLPISALTTEHFATLRQKLAAGRSVVSLGNEVTRLRVLCKWFYESGLVDKPINFGPDFRRPSRKALRKHRREQPKKLFTADQIHALLDEAGLHLRAMIWLGINCAFGNTDCATLPLSLVDLDAGWHHYPRPKTEVERSAPLWPETIDALRASLRRRPKPQPGYEGRFFLMPDGSPWEESAKPITKQFRQAVLRAGLKLGGFYWLRHTFATVAGGSKDQVAVNAIMGHADGSMAAQYREEIDRERLLAVAAVVRRWLIA